MGVETLPFGYLLCPSDTLRERRRFALAEPALCAYASRLRRETLRQRWTHMQRLYKIIVEKIFLSKPYWYLNVTNQYKENTMALCARFTAIA